MSEAIKKQLYIVGTISYKVTQTNYKNIHCGIHRNLFSEIHRSASVLGLQVFLRIIYSILVSVLKFVPSHNSDAGTETPKFNIFGDDGTFRSQCTPAPLQ